MVYYKGGFDKYCSVNKKVRANLYPVGKGCCTGIGGAMQIMRSVTRNPFTYEVPVLVSGVRFVHLRSRFGLQIETNIWFH
ncbi:MAG: hypothetical protein ACLTZT_16670 [Butyricimonas faecalis]